METLRELYENILGLKLFQNEYGYLILTITVAVILLILIVSLYFCCCTCNSQKQLQSPEPPLLPRRPSFRNNYAQEPSQYAMASVHGSDLARAWSSERILNSSPLASSYYVSPDRGQMFYSERLPSEQPPAYLDRNSHSTGRVLNRSGSMDDQILPSPLVRESIGSGRMIGSNRGILTRS